MISFLLCTDASQQKTAQQFLKDALDVFALRRGVKAKELIPPSSSMDKAINAAYGQLDKTNQGFVRGAHRRLPEVSGRIKYSDFEEFVNQSDLEEALALITGQTGPRDVAATVDASKMVWILGRCGSLTTA